MTLCCEKESKFVIHIKVAWCPHVSRSKGMINLLNFSLLLLAQSAIFRYVFSIFIKTRLTFKKFVMRLFLNCSAYNIYCAHCSFQCLVKVNFYDKTFLMLKCDKRAFLVYFFSFSKIKKSHKFEHWATLAGWNSKYGTKQMRNIVSTNI